MRAFRKVELPARESRLRLTPGLLGETVDTSGAFSSEDAARAAWLREQLAQEDAKRKVDVRPCGQCGRPMRARITIREYCNECGLLREAERQQAYNQRKREATDG